MSDADFEIAEAHRRISNLIRPGTIEEVQLGDDPSKATARIKFDDDWTSDFLRVFQVHSGRVSSWSPPVEGEQVLVLSPSGLTEGGYALRGLPSTAFPSTSNSADLLQLFDAGDGSSDVYDLAAKTRTITTPGGTKVAGSMEIEGNLKVSTGQTVSFTTSTGQTLFFQDGILTGVN
jgi:phage baseplate assembly protein V